MLRRRALSLGTAFAAGCLFGGRALLAAQKPKPPQLDILSEEFDRRKKPAPARPAPPEKQPTPLTEDQKRIAALIDQLAPPNAEPKEEAGEITWPFDYDRAAQRRVIVAWDALLDYQEKAFPQLIEGMKDHRYSCTVSSPSGDYNKDVAWSCKFILQMQVQAYEPQVGWFGVWRPDVMPEGAAYWWKGREKRTLRELQLEAAAEATRQLSAMTAKEAIRRTFYFSGKFEDFQSKGLEALRKFHAELDKSDKAVVIRRGDRIHICGLPPGEKQRGTWNPK